MQYTKDMINKYLRNIDSSSPTVEPVPAMPDDSEPQDPIELNNCYQF